MAGGLQGRSRWQRDRLRPAKRPWIEHMGRSPNGGRGASNAPVSSDAFVFGFWIVYRLRARATRPYHASSAVLNLLVLVGVRVGLTGRTLDRRHGLGIAAALSSRRRGRG